MIKSMLNNLNKEELFLTDKVRKARGSMDDILTQLIRDGVINKYQEIYLSYNKLYAESKSLEALKRIIFIQWYAVSEPPIYSGINYLDKELQKINMLLIKTLIDEDLLDLEFKIMLFHYYIISDWYFDSYSDFSSISKFNKEDMYMPLYATDFENRGQMGMYWQSLNRTIKG
jgi:hypothetical protein